MEETRRQLIETGRKLYERGWIVATEGNLSCRIGPNRFLVTASGVCKGEMGEEDLVLVDENGLVLQGDRKPSTEIAMHLEVYRQRPDVQAVVHAHPPYVLALSLTGLNLDRPYLPESVLVLGKVPFVSYARPSTGQVPESIRPFIRQTDVLVLHRHGSLTVGKSLQEAFWKLEYLEHTAHIVWLARQVGHPNPMPIHEVWEVLKLRKSVYGLDFPIRDFD